MVTEQELQHLNSQIDGTVAFDKIHRTIYATDASVYRELPVAVVYPKSVVDIQTLVYFATQHKTSLIPRTAGTSLAGQCVGNGIVVDVSKHFNQIVETNPENKTVTVQPGVVRDELNLHLKQFDLFFGPETSTANRAMIGGMVGNNSCGTNSIVYGTTRDHLVSVDAVLSDGSLATFTNVSEKEFEDKCELKTLEGAIYRQIKEQLSKKNVQEEIINEFPNANIHRRNTGYAVDELIHTQPFNKGTVPFNFCKLIAGSEGTLAFITKITLQCLPVPPSKSKLVAVHFNSVANSLKGVLVAMKHQPYTCELMDKIVMDCTKENKAFEHYRFFLVGDPEAVLLIEFRAEDTSTIEQQCNTLIQDFKNQNLGYAFPIINQEDSKNVWHLRKAGLGLLANIPGDEKAVAVIEDTAVQLQDLPAYIQEFSSMMEAFKQRAVYYAHAGAGELHLRPILNLKKKSDVQLFEEIALATAHLVKKYNGSLSGEHGDGRVRAPFLPLMIGEQNYNLLKEIKQTWDPNNVFNPGKIIDAAPISQSLRYQPDVVQEEPKTILNFDDAGGFLRMAEKCNGSGDCRKSSLAGGTMCPSYMATKNEKDTTRARANALREFITQSNSERAGWESEEIKEVLDLCLSCKGCKTECPSNVDMAALKAEFTYQYNKTKGLSFQSKMFANVSKLNRLGSLLPQVTNLINSTSMAKQVMGIAPQRTPPSIAKQTLKKWFQKNSTNPPTPIKKVYFFADEFTNYLDVEVGKKAILLLQKLGYHVDIAPISDSARAFISKGLLEEAKEIALSNVQALIPLISDATPLIGIEPSAILSFRDEYIRFIENKEFKDSCIVKHSLMLDEFLAKEHQLGFISSEQFVSEHHQIVLHGHCHQKALSNTSNSVTALSIPKNYHVQVLPTGCCGMAGSFGYEKEHYDVSMKIGNLVLFPAVKKLDSKALICAPGTSCRHQIYDGTKRTAAHTAEILYDALIKE